MELQEQGMSMADVLAFFAAQSAQQQATLLEAVKEMKKPDAEEQAKRDEEKARKASHRAHGIEMAKKAEEEKLWKQSHCSHLRENGSHNFRGQVNSDGMIRPFCSYCLMVLPAIKATQSVGEPVDMAKWPNATIDNLVRLARDAKNKAA